MMMLRALFLSLAIHFLLLILIDLGAPYFDPKAPESNRTVTEIDLIPQNPKTKKEPEKKQQQIVRQVVPPKSQLKEDDPEDLARFLSADRQRVKKEMQAAHSGMTQNRESTTSKRSVSQAEKTQKQQPRNPNEPSSESVDIAKNLQEYARSVEAAPSTVGEALPQDVSIGSFTALNTDHFKYYSFFSRVEELIRFRWESRVRQGIDGFDRNYILSVVSQKNWVTTVDIWLNKDGRFHSAHILKESGIAQFDQAATRAFKEAGMFSNPPQDLVEDDGYIHLKYNFEVRFRPSAVVFQN